MNQVANPGLVTEAAPQPGLSVQMEKPKEICSTPEHCKCNGSCVELMEKLSECVICLNSLQNSGVRACNRCGSFWCGECSMRVASCPFCRAPPPQVPCTALHRLLKDLTLPCKYRRWGCGEVLNTDSRRGHETNCPYGQLCCPLRSNCLRTFPSNKLISHIYNHHSLIAVNTSTLNIKMENFSEKMSASAGFKQKYETILISHNNVFLIELTMHNFTLVIKVTKKDLEYAVNRYPYSSKDSFFAIINFQSKIKSTRFKLLVDDLYHAKQTLIEEGEHLQKSWPGEDVNVFVTITHLSDNNRLCTLTV